MIASIVLYLFCCGAGGMNLFVLPQPRGSRVGRRLHSAQIQTYMQHKPIYTAQYNQGICNWELPSDLRRNGSCSKNFVKIIRTNITVCIHNNFVRNSSLSYLHWYRPFPGVIRTVKDLFWFTVSGSRGDWTLYLRGLRVRAQFLPLISKQN